MNPINPAALYWATFNNLQFRIPGAAVLDICKSGSNDDAVAKHLPEVRRLVAELYPEPGNPWEPIAARIREELAEYGTWDETELADEEANWSRLLWLAAWNVFEDDERDSSDPVGPDTVPTTAEETPAPEPVETPTEDELPHPTPWGSFLSEQLYKWKAGEIDCGCRAMAIHVRQIVKEEIEKAAPPAPEPPTPHPSGAWSRSDYANQFDKLRDHLKALVSESFYGDSTGYYHCDPATMRAAKAHLESLEQP